MKIIAKVRYLDFQKRSNTVEVQTVSKLTSSATNTQILAQQILTKPFSITLEPFFKEEI